MTNRDSLESNASKGEASTLDASCDADSGLAQSSSDFVLAGARQGRPSAFDKLFRRLLPSVQRWARGRLPKWARRRVDTADVVQEAFVNLFRTLPHLEPKRERVLRAYLLTSIQNRIRDEVRRAGKVEVDAESGLVEVADRQDSPLDRATSAQNEHRLRLALARLGPTDQALVVGRIDLGYSYDQLALALRKRSPDAARVAVRRAVLRLAQEIESAAH